MADRIFVDSIFGFGNGTSTLSRSLDHGDSFRPLIDLTCANRNRPTCQTNGGGDVVDRVNLYDGTVYFGDQEAVATESLASSIDHGDTWQVTATHKQRPARWRITTSCLRTPSLRSRPGAPRRYSPPPPTTWFSSACLVAHSLMPLPHAVPLEWF